MGPQSWLAGVWTEGGPGVRPEAGSPVPRPAVTQEGSGQISGDPGVGRVETSSCWPLEDGWGQSPSRRGCPRGSDGAARAPGTHAWTRASVRLAPRWLSAPQRANSSGSLPQTWMSATWVPGPVLPLGVQRAQGQSLALWEFVIGETRAQRPWRHRMQGSRRSEPRELDGEQGRRRGWAAGDTGGLLARSLDREGTPDLGHGGITSCQEREDSAAGRRKGD